MIEHPLIAYIEDLDRRLDEIIDKQKHLHYASVLGKPQMNKMKILEK